MKIQAFKICLTIIFLSACFAATGAETSERADSTHARIRVDETLVWNQVMLDAIVASTLGNPQTIRMAATVNSAMFDAQNGIGFQTHRPIFVTARAPRGAHGRAALVQAAYVTLKSFYPAQLSRFDQQRALSLAEFEGDDPADVRRGIEWGENVANQILAWRATDGFSDPVVPFTGAGAIVGQWESATDTSMSAGNMAFTAPFVLTSNTQFQSAFPRPWATLAGPEFAADYNEVATMGVKSGSARTLDQTHIAFFFNGYATNDYIEAAIQIARKHGTSRRDNSRIFALLTIAMHDTTVTVFRAKLDFGMNPSELTWRPIVALRRRISTATPVPPGSPAGFRSSRRRITRSIRPRTRRHTARAPACSSTSSVIATRSSSTPRSTPSSQDLPMEESSRGVTRAYRPWRRKASTRVPMAACIFAARATRRRRWVPGSPTTSSNMRRNRCAGAMTTIQSLCEDCYLLGAPGRPMRAKTSGDFAGGPLVCPIPRRCVSRPRPCRRCAQSP